MNKISLITLFGIGSLVILTGAPFIGVKTVPLEALFRTGNELEIYILWQIRIPRVFFAFLAGAGLALSGMAFQAMFRNPLATPFTLGVASGASFGATLAIRLGITVTVLGLSSISFCAFLGGLLTIILVYSLTKVRTGFSTATMLLAGVALSFFFSSFILFLQYVSDFTHSFRIIRWLMGELNVVGYDSLLNIFPFVACGVVLIFYLTQELNLLAISEEIAIARGAEVDRVKKILFFATSLMVGGIVAVCGPIGFVGMMVPHICRLIIGSDHRYLTPLVFLFGGVFLIICDTLARVLIAPAEIPVGIITALLGGPFFIWLLLRGALRGEIL